MATWPISPLAAKKQKTVLRVGPKMDAMTMTQGGEQIPIPCGRCGGPMREEGPVALVGPVQVRCPFCQATEVLPREQAQRVMALRARLAHLRSAQAAEEGPALAFAHMMQTLRGQIGVYAIVGVVVVGGGTSSAVTQVNTALALRDIPLSAREDLLSSVTFSAISVGVILGAATGYLLALVEYKKAIAPRLRAHAPLHPGLPARCRSCGAPLPMGPGLAAIVPCMPCGAHNLLTAELASDRARLLEEETRSYHQRASGVLTRATRASATLRHYFYIGAGTGLVLALALALGAGIRLFVTTFLF